MRFFKGARREFLAAGDEYDGISPTLASEFGQRVDAALQTILEYPDAGSPHLYGTRRMVLTQFPYSLIYRVLRAEIAIVAVPHHRQELGYWKNRMV